MLENLYDSNVFFDCQVRKVSFRSRLDKIKKDLKSLSKQIREHGGFHSANSSNVHIKDAFPGTNLVSHPYPSLSGLGQIHIESKILLGRMHYLDKIHDFYLKLDPTYILSVRISSGDSRDFRASLQQAAFVSLKEALRGFPKNPNFDFEEHFSIYGLDDSIYDKASQDNQASDPKEASLNFAGKQPGFEISLFLKGSSSKIGLEIRTGDGVNPAYVETFNLKQASTVDIVELESRAG